MNTNTSIPFNHIILSDELKEECNCDIIDQFNDCIDENENVEIIETTINDLASNKCKTICGYKNNNAFELAAKKYPTIKVRCCYNIDENEVGSCDMLIDSQNIGDDICELVNSSGGSLRCDYIPGKWGYFETE